MNARRAPRAGAAAALVSIVVATSAVRAQAPDEAAALARAACTGQPAVAPATPAAWPDLLRSDPAAALAHACAGLDAGTAAATAVAEALTALHRLDEARRLLEQLRARIDTAPPGDDTAAVHGALGMLAIEDGANAQATGHFERALAALVATGRTGTRRHAQVLVGLAQGWVNARAPGDLERADAALAQVTDVLAALDLGTSRDMSDVLNLRAVIAYARQDLPATVAWARAEVDMYRRLGLGDDPEQLHTLTTIGSVSSQLGRFDEAEAAFREGLRIMALRPDAEPAGQLGILNNLATLWRDRGRHDAALETAERAVALAERVYGPQALRLLTPLTVRGQAEWALARYAPARRSFEAALAIAERDRASVGVLRLLRLNDGLAAAQQALGDVDAARTTLDDALRTLAAADGHLGYWRGRVLRSRAGQAARAGAWSLADAQYAQAIDLIAPVIGADHAFVVSMLAERCAAQARGRLPGEACGQLAARLDRLAAAAPGMRFVAQAALALAADAAGRAAEAREHHLLALAAAVSAGGPDPLWSAYDALAGHLRAGGERALAVVAAKQAVEQIERMRGELGADARRYERGFLADKLQVYRRLADWLTDDGRIDEALQVLRLLKQEEFNDFVRGAPGAPAASPVRLATEREAPLRRAFEAALPPPAAMPAWPDLLSPGEQAAQRDAFAAQARQEAERAAAWRDLLEAHRDVHPARVPPAVEPRALMAGPGHGVPGELRVWAYTGAAHLNLVLQGPQRREVLRLALDPPALARDVGRLLAAVGQRDDVRAPLQRLYEQLGRPIWQRARRDGARRLVLHLDGVLRYLPFAALHDGQRYLGERLAIEQRLATLDAPPVAAPSNAATMLRAVGVTRSFDGLAPLGALAREVCGIVDGPVQGLDADDPACAAGDGGRRGRGLLPGAAWLNAAFTADRLVQVAAEGRPDRRDLLHVGTHFVLRPGNMTRSWLLLGDGARLHLDALARMSFAGQDLVTLSACETGIGGSGDPASAGQEVDSLNGLVMRRGAGAVLASLWRVEDDSTSVLMLALYRELGRGTDPAVALQRAQAAVRESAGGRRAHPFHWAGFYLVSAEP